MASLYTFRLPRNQPFGEDIINTVEGQWTGVTSNCSNLKHSVWDKLCEITYGANIRQHRLRYNNCPTLFLICFFSPLPPPPAKLQFPKTEYTASSKVCGLDSYIRQRKVMVPHIKCKIRKGTQQGRLYVSPDK